MKKLVLIIILFFGSKLVLGQDPFYTKIDKSKGLPSNSVYNIFQDSKGFMWFATNDGLSRYDGFEFKTYYSVFQTSKSGSEIKEDKFGRIWYENFDGYLYYVENDSLHAFKQSVPFGYMDFAIINNSLLIMQQSGFDIYDLASLKHKKTVILDVSHLSFAKQLGNTYLVSLNKKIVYDENGVVVRQISEPYLNGNDKPVSAIPALHNNTLYLVGARNNLRMCCGESKEGLVQKFSVNTTFMFQNFCSTGDYLWICTPGGVYCSDTTGKYGSNGKVWFASKNINCVYRSRDNCYWFGTANEGLFLVKDLNTKVHTIQNCSPTKLTNINNQIVIGTKDDKIVLFDAKNSTSKVLDFNIDNHPILFLKFEKNSNTLYYTSKLFHQYKLSSKGKDGYTVAVKDIELLDEKYISIAASGFVGLYCINKSAKYSKWDSLFNANQKEKELNLDLFADIIQSVRAKSIAKWKTNPNFYCATNIGFFEVLPNRYREIKYKGQPVYFSKIEVVGNLLIGLATNGLIYKMEMGKDLIQLPNFTNVSNLFLCDSLLCINTGSNISFYSEKNGELSKQAWSFVLANEQVNDMLLINKKLFVSTDNGLLEMNMNLNNRRATEVNFIINNTLVNGHPKQKSELMKLSYLENDVEINYSVLDYKNEVGHLLQYKINDGDWKILPTNTRTLHLAGLAGGNYFIEFKLDNNVMKDSVLQFAISTPWWKQIWFLIVCFVLVCVLIVIYYKWQTSVLKKKNLLLIQKIELEKNLNQSMLTSIKAQMNPHFFYNALNTIQSYIFTDDKKNATNYLSKFSKLTRIILEMSEKESISLSEEINALTLYLDLEKVRFNHDFEFNIKVGNAVNIEMIKIPSMIIQPFIENAIKHGLLHKKGEKVLAIEFLMNENKLEVIIDDNGIGRKKSEELNKIKEIKHSSFSTSANSKRLEILNEGKTNKVGLEILDKYDTNNQSEGTKVIIQIPL